jgi:hypothetical protein
MNSTGKIKLKYFKRKLEVIDAKVDAGLNITILRVLL